MMGNCASTQKGEIDGQAYEESQKSPAMVQSDKHGDTSPMIPALKDIDDDDEYYKSEDNVSEDHSAWEIIEYGRNKTSGNVHWKVDRAVSLQTLDMDRTRPRSVCSETRVRFSAYEEQQIYECNEETSSLFTPGGKTNTTKSMESIMSYSSVMSTATISERVFDDSLLPTRIQILLHYDQKLWLLKVGVKQLQCSLDPMFENHRVYWQVQITLHPYKMKKRQTKYKRSSNPVFNQAFEVKRIGKSVLNDMAVRYRVYGKIGRAGRKRLAGEVQVDLESLRKQPENTILEWRTLRTSRNRIVRRESLESYNN